MKHIVRKASASDVKPIHAALLRAASAGLMLSRSLSQLYSHIRDFMVLEDGDGKMLGFCALAVMWENIGEIRSLFVHENLRGNGYGRVLVEACLEEARVLGISQVFTLTYQTGFFAGLDFEVVAMDTLPQKIWADCIHCPKFPDCDETAMMRRV